MGKAYICLEMGGTNLRLGLVDEAMCLRHFEKHPTRLLADAEDKIAFLTRILTPLMDRAGGTEQVLAVSLSLASLMDGERRTVYSSPMVSGFDNLALADELERRLGVTVVMEKDVNLLLLYEIHRSGLPLQGVVLGVFLGTGLGNAMCINGQVYRGFSGAACELGHIPMPELNEPCGCGKMGCIELRACGKRLAELADRLGCPVEELFIRCSDHPELRRIVYYFAIAIAIEASILDPAMVLLGGGVADMPGFPLTELEEMVRQHVRAPYPRRTLRFARASGDDEAGVIGAALHARQTLFRV